MTNFTKDLLYEWDSTTSRLQYHYKEVVYFLSLSCQKILVPILIDLRRMKIGVVLGDTQ